MRQFRLVEVPLAIPGGMQGHGDEGVEGLRVGIVKELDERAVEVRLSPRQDQAAQPQSAERVALVQGHELVPLQEDAVDEQDDMVDCTANLMMFYARESCTVDAAAYRSLIRPIITLT